MGGNIVSVYAGVRPERVARLINLEGFGLPATRPEQAPGRYADWLDELRSAAGHARLRQPGRGGGAPAQDQSAPGRPSAPRSWRSTGRRRTRTGEWEILGDPAHKMRGPLLYQAEEVLACWRRITAPVLWVEAEHTDMWRWMGPKEQARAEVDRRLAQIARRHAAA